MKIADILPGGSRKAEASCKVINRLGLHARPACLLVQKSSEFKSEIFFRNAQTSQGEAVNGKSLMSILTLAAACGSVIEVTAEGEDAETAVAEIVKLFESGFDED